jgi:hypothetical protein
MPEDAQRDSGISYQTRVCPRSEFNSLTNMRMDLPDSSSPIVAEHNKLICLRANIARVGIALEFPSSSRR